MHTYHKLLAGQGYPLSVYVCVCVCVCVVLSVPASVPMHVHTVDICRVCVCVFVQACLHLVISPMICKPFDRLVMAWTKCGSDPLTPSGLKQ